MDRDPNDPTFVGGVGLVHQWLANGWDPDLDVLPTVREVTAKMAKRGDAPRTLGLFTGAIEQAHLRRISAGKRGGQGVASGAALPADDPDIDRDPAFLAIQRDGFRRTDEYQLGLLCKSWFGRKQWPDEWGPKPGEAGSFVTAEFVERWKAGAGAKAGNVVALHGERAKANG